MGQMVSSGREGVLEAVCREHGWSACCCWMFYLLSWIIQPCAPPFSDLLSYTSIVAAQRKCASHNTEKLMAGRYMRIYDVRIEYLFMDK